MKNNLLKIIGWVLILIAIILIAYGLIFANFVYSVYSIGRLNILIASSIYLVVIGLLFSIKLKSK